MEGRPKRKKLVESLMEHREPGLDEAAAALKRLEDGEDAQQESAGTRERILPPGTWFPYEDWLEWLRFLETGALGYLSTGQKKAFPYLLLQSNGITNYPLIEDATGVPAETARYYLRRFRSVGLIVSCRKMRFGHFRGVHFELGAEPCGPYLRWLQDRPHIGNPHAKILGRIPSPATTPRAPTTSRDSPAASKPTPAAESRSSQGTEGMESNPELLWWFHHYAVDDRTIANWSAEFGIGIEPLHRYLRWCRFYLLHVDKEEVHGRNKGKGYFYGALRSNGRFDRPDGYKSLAELHVEELEEETRKLNEARERLEQARQERFRAQMTLEAERLLDAPDSPEHNRVAECLSAFIRNTYGRDSDSFRNEFLRKYLEWKNTGKLTPEK